MKKITYVKKLYNQELKKFNKTLKSYPLYKEFLKLKRNKDEAHEKWMQYVTQDFEYCGNQKLENNKQLAEKEFNEALKIYEDWCEETV